LKQEAKCSLSLSICGELESSRSHSHWWKEFMNLESGVVPRCNLSQNSGLHSQPHSLA